MRVRETRDSPFKYLNQKSALKIKNRAAVVCNSGALQLGAERLARISAGSGISRPGQPCAVRCCSACRAEAVVEKERISEGLRARLTA